MSMPKVLRIRSHSPDHFELQSYQHFDFLLEGLSLYAFFLYSSSAQTVATHYRCSI